MIISDLNHLEVVSELSRIVGGATPTITGQSLSTISTSGDGKPVTLIAMLSTTGQTDIKKLPTITSDVKKLLQAI